MPPPGKKVCTSEVMSHQPEAAGEPQIAEGIVEGGRKRREREEVGL